MNKETNHPRHITRGPSTCWRDSHHRLQYLVIAMLTLSTPGHVYEVAHQTYCLTRKERLIFTFLVQAGVITR